MKLTMKTTTNHNPPLISAFQAFPTFYFSSLNAKMFFRLRMERIDILLFKFNWPNRDFFNVCRVKFYSLINFRKSNMILIGQKTFSMRNPNQKRLTLAYVSKYVVDCFARLPTVKTPIQTSRSRITALNSLDYSCSKFRSISNLKWCTQLKIP